MKIKAKLIAVTASAVIAVASVNAQEPVPASWEWAGSQSIATPLVGETNIYYVSGSWLGDFVAFDDDGWIYHINLGFMYPVTPGEYGGFWFYGYAFGWSWTGDGIFPWLYLAEYTQDWAYYIEGTDYWYDDLLEEFFVVPTAEFSAE